MRQPFSQGPVIGIFVLLFAAFSLRAQESQAMLDLQTESGKTTFHIGERIPLKLTFSSLSDAEYRIDRVAAVGRGCGSESVTVSPFAGWSDPTALYFAQGNFGCAYSGPGPQPFLKGTTVVRTTDLNQWVRFDEPGVYEVKISGGQVMEVSGADRKRIPLQSNTLELHIIAATPEWQAEKLQSVRNGLNNAARYPEYNDAEADLLYLATPGSIDEMTSSFRGTCCGLATQYTLGLIGLPPALHELAVASMEKRITEADFPITADFICALSFLHVKDGSDAASIREQIQQSNVTLWRTIFSALPGKDAAARAVTIQTLLTHGHDVNTPDIQSQMASLLDASFPNLDRFSQLTDLRQHWDLLRSQPDILPALKKIATLPEPVADYNLPSSTDEIKSAAFWRWYELDPAGAHSEILAEIGSATPELSAQALSFLPPEQLPQFESIWSQAFLSTTNQLQERLLGSLLVRFGTGAATPQMISKLKEPQRNYGCDAHYRALAYLVRFSPDDARPLLEREIATDEAGCGGMLLQWISQEATGPVLNDAAVEHLKTNNAARLRDAVAYLTFYGRKQDEEPLWHRYVRWTDAWKATPELVDGPDPNPSVEPQGWIVGMELGRALIANQGWFADQGLISRVLERCVGKQMCSQLNNIVSSGEQPYRLWIPNTEEPGYAGFNLHFTVAQYSARSLELFEAKVSQFPAGTTFALPNYPDNSDERKLEDEVQSILKKHGMATQPQTR